MATQEQIKQVALHLANLVAPTGKEQRGFVALVNTMEKHGESAEQVNKALVRAIFDGMVYGNWRKP